MTQWAPATLRRRLRSLNAAGWLRTGVIICAVVAVGLTGVARAQTPSPDAAIRLVGRPAPAFSLPVAHDGARLAAPVAFSEMTKQPTLLVFFDTLCVHCLAGVQTANEASDTAQRLGAQIIYIDSPGENAQITQQYMARLQIDPPVALDAHGRVASRYGVSFFPTMILVDAHGIIRDVWVGAPRAGDVRSAIGNVSRS